MLDSTTDDIISGTDRIPTTGTDTKSVDPNTKRIDKPEIINGFDVDSPRTERIGGTDSGDTIKRTKSGKPDGRSTRFNRGKSDTGDTTEAKVRLESFSIEGLLMGIHQGLSIALQSPELEISEKEAKILSDGVQAVAKEYNHVINPKTAAWMQLCGALGTVYGFRILAVRARTKGSKKGKLVAMPPSTPEPGPYTPPVVDPIERDGAI